MTKRSIAAALLAAPVLAVVAPSAAMATNKPDPCPGQHIQVYNENSNTKVAHYVCGPLAGKDGKDGKDGATGPKGDTGAQGATGATGPAGPAGPIGPQGPQGETGAAGSDGATGPAGPAGATGAVGPQGETGPSGPAGATGAAGGDGSPGATGPVGPAGADGKSAFINAQPLRNNASELYCDGNGGVVFAYGLLHSDTPLKHTVLCNGADGAPGEVGPAGPAGLAGKAGKTTIVHTDGTTEEVDGLPATGGSDNAWLLGLVGVGILSAGAGAIWVLRKQA